MIRLSNVMLYLLDLYNKHRNKVPQTPLVFFRIVLHRLPENKLIYWNIIDEYSTKIIFLGTSQFLIA